MFFDIRVSAEDWLSPNGHYGGELNTVMQCTGLKDKKGKEIYEGDICRHASGRPEVNSVEYYYGEWHLEPHGLHLSDEYEQVEVIGNIYENPELLKATK